MEDGLTVQSFYSFQRISGPLKQGTPDMTEVNRERRKVQIACAAVVCQLVMDCREFPTWRRLLRVTAYGIRFCRNLHFKLSQQSDTNQVQVGPLRARRRSHHYEIPAGFEKVFLIPWLSQGSTIRQRFTNDRSWTRIAPDDRGMEQQPP